MKKLAALLGLLGLPEDATEQQIDEAIKVHNESAEAAREHIAQFESKQGEQEQQIKNLSQENTELKQNLAKSEEFNESLVAKNEDLAGQLQKTTPKLDPRVKEKMAAGLSRADAEAVVAEQEKADKASAKK